MEQEKLHVVYSVFEAFGRGDIPAMLEFIDPAVEWILFGPESVPHYGARRGHEGVKEFFAALGSALDFESFEPREFIVGDDKVVVLGRERVRGCATGRTADNQWAMVFTIHAGKVRRFIAYEDTAAVASVLRD